MQEDRPQPEKAHESRTQSRGAGLRGLLEQLRSLPERLKRPESLLMFMAMFASLGAHMPPWLGLGALADYFSKQEVEEQRAAPVEVSFEVSDEKPVEEAPTMKDEDPSPKAKQESKVAKPEPPKPELPKPPEKKQEQVTEVEIAQVPPPPPPPSQNRRQSITQKSEDPNVEPPPDAKFVAEESRRVEEETVASVLSPTRDDPVPEKSAPEAANEPEQAGDARKDEKGEAEGSDQPEEAVVAQPLPSPAPPPPTPEQSASAQRPQPAPSPRAPSAPSAPSIPEGTVIQDPLGGSFVLAQPKRSSAPAAEQRGGAASAAPAAQPSIKVSWRSFEETFGAEQLARDRTPRGAKRRGAGREKRWNEFRAAIENYVVGVKPGNQTALNAAADPFAAYLAAFHRHLHMEFAHQFLESLPVTGKLGNPTLMAKVEIVVNPDGSLDRVGIVKSSGDLMYDFGAFNAVQRGAPYPPPPEKIRSKDGRTYMRWALYRNESQCGTWNAEPYILKSPPRSPNDPKQDNVSPYQSPSRGSENGRAPAEPAHVPSDSGKAPGETLGVVSDPRRLGLVARR